MSGWGRKVVTANSLALTASAMPTNVDLAALPVWRNQSVLPGETWHFQAWFKDGASSNFTDGLSVLFQ